MKKSNSESLRNIHCFAGGNSPFTAVQDKVTIVNAAVMVKSISITLILNRLSTHLFTMRLSFKTEAVGSKFDREKIGKCALEQLTATSMD